jgi:hypothetical protein
VIAYLAPFAAEWLHLTPRTYTFDGSALRIQPWAMDLPPQLAIGLTVVCVLFQIAVHAIMLLRQRRAQERAQELLHLQRWQLGQLLPEPTTESHAA